MEGPATNPSWVVGTLKRTITQRERIDAENARRAEAEDQKWERGNDVHFQDLQARVRKLVDANRRDELLEKGAQFARDARDAKGLADFLLRWRDMIAEAEKQDAAASKRWKGMHPKQREQFDELVAKCAVIGLPVDALWEARRHAMDPGRDLGSTSTTQPLTAVMAVLSASIDGLGEAYQASSGANQRQAREEFARLRTVRDPDELRRALQRVRATLGPT